MKKVQEFVGASPALSDENFVQDPETGFFCIQMNPPDGECLMPGGNKGRTNKAHMDVEVEKVLKRFFRAVEPDNLEVFSDVGFSWTQDLLNPAIDTAPIK